MAGKPTKDWSSVEMEIYRKANRDLWLKIHDLEEDVATLRDANGKWQEKEAKDQVKIGNLQREVQELELLLQQKCEQTAKLEARVKELLGEKQSAMKKDGEEHGRLERIRRQCETFGVELLEAEFGQRQREPKIDQEFEVDDDEGDSDASSESLFELQQRNEPGDGDQLPLQLSQMDLASSPTVAGSENVAMAGGETPVPGPSSVTPNAGTSSTLDEDCEVVVTISSGVARCMTPRGRKKLELPCLVCNNFVASGGQELMAHVTLEHFTDPDAPTRNRGKYGWCTICGVSFTLLKHVEAHVGFHQDNP